MTRTFHQILLATACNVAHALLQVRRDVSFIEFPKIRKQDIASLDWRFVEVPQVNRPAPGDEFLTPWFRKLEREPLRCEGRTDLISAIQGSATEEMSARQVVSIRMNRRHQFA